MIENQDKLIHIHDNEVNNITECNLLHYITKSTKRAKNINRHNSHIIHGCINTRKGIEKFKNSDLY